MRKIYSFALFAFIILLSSCQSKTETEKTNIAESSKTSSSTTKAVQTETKTSPQVDVVQFDAIESLMSDQSGNLQVINFWATWCKPCVKELPYFESAYEKHANNGVNFTLVSLDFVEDLDNKVIPFVERKELKSKVLLLDNTKYDTWISKVSEDWDGAIPITVFTDKKKGFFKVVKGEIHQEELENIISEYKSI